MWFIEKFNTTYEAEIYVLQLLLENKISLSSLQYHYVTNNVNKIIRLHYLIDDKIIIKRYCTFEYDTNGKSVATMIVEYDDNFGKEEINKWMTISDKIFKINDAN